MIEPLSEPAPSTPDVDDMTKNELLAYAAENGVDGVSGSMNKADIKAAIMEAL